MFCAGPETFTLIYKSCTFFYLGKAADFHSPRRIERNGSAVEPGAGLIPEPLQRLRLAEMILFPL
jgi:hypothetical protein